MSDPVEAEWTIESGDFVLRLVLSKIDDRYAHRIEALSLADEPIACLVSVEGDSTLGPTLPAIYRDLAASVPANAESARLGISDSWPASPPFQQFHDQEIAGRRTWFLVGMAGKSHWSASIVALDDAVGWEFDIACRYRATPGFLGSRYLAVEPTGTRMSPAVSNALAAWSNWQFVVRDSSAATISSGDFTVGPGSIANAPESARWRYAWAAARR